MIAQVHAFPADDDVSAAVGMLRLLGQPTRLRIVWALLDGEHSVGELTERLGVAAPAVSQHLAKLRLAGLVRTRREGTRVIYEIDDEHVRGLADAVLVHAGHRTAERGARRTRR